MYTFDGGTELLLLGMGWEKRVIIIQFFFKSDFGFYALNNVC